MRLILNFGIFSLAFRLTPRWNWSTEGTGSKTRWHSTCPLAPSPRRPNLSDRRRTASSSAKSARRVSAYSDSSTDTWNATAMSSAIFVPSVEKASTTPLTWKDTQELIQVQIDYFVLCGLIFVLHFSCYSSSTCSGVRPYKCNLCEKSFTQRCSLESHCLKVHGVAHQYDYKQRRSKVRENMGRNLLQIIPLHRCMSAKTAVTQLRSPKSTISTWRTTTPTPRPFSSSTTRDTSNSTILILQVCYSSAAHSSQILLTWLVTTVMWLMARTSTEDYLC